MALDISALELSLNGWALAGYVATGVVALGCLGESIVEFTNWIKSGSCAKKIGAGSAILLIIGLAAEILTQVKLNTMNGQIIAILDDEAAQAKDRFAKDEIALSQVRTKRTINDRKYATLVACFRDSPKIPIYLRPGFLDPDAKDLSDRIQSALNDANFPAPPPWPKESGALTWNTPGTFLLLQDLQNPPIGAASLQKCLMKIDMAAPAYPDPKQPAGTISIGIGPRF